MKNKVINAAVCDARKITEESLAGFDSISVNGAILLTSPRAKEIMNRYPVRLNTAMVLEIPDGQEVSVKIANGKAAIGPGDDGTGVFLIVNGRLTVEDGSEEAVRSYYRILVNGKLLMPAGYRGRFPDLSVNGRTEYYPDGAALTSKASLSFTPPFCAALQTALCVRLLTGHEVETGKLYVADLLDMDLESVFL